MNDTLQIQYSTADTEDCSVNTT